MAAPQQKTTFVVEEMSLREASQSTPIEVPPEPVGPIGPQPLVRRNPLKHKLWDLQFALTLELGTLNSICDNELEPIPEDQLDEQFQAEVLGEYRGRVKAHLSELEVALRRVNDTHALANAFIARAEEEFQPELDEFMEEFLGKNNFHAHKTASVRLINRLRKNLSEVDKRLACLRRRECSILSLSLTRQSGHDNGPPRQSAENSANDSGSMRGFAHSTPIGEDNRTANAVRNGGDARNQARQPEFNSSVIPEESNAHKLHDHANNARNDKHHSEQVFRGGLHRENEQGTIESIDGSASDDVFSVRSGEHRSERDFRTSHGEHHGRSPEMRNRGRGTENSELNPRASRPTGRHGHGHGNFDKSPSPAYRGRSSSRDNPNSLIRPQQKQVRWTADTKTEENSSSPRTQPAAEDAPPIPPRRPPASEAPPIPPRIPPTSGDGRPPTSGFEPGGPGAGGVRGYGPTSGPPPVVSRLASATCTNPFGNPDQGGLYIAHATAGGGGASHQVARSAGQYGGWAAPRTCSPPGYPRSGIPQGHNFVNYVTQPHDHGGGQTGNGGNPPRPENAACGNGYATGNPDQGGFNYGGGVTPHYTAPAQAHYGGQAAYQPGCAIGGTPPPRTASAGTTRGNEEAYNTAFYQSSPAFAQSQCLTADQRLTNLDLPYRKNYCPVFSGDAKVFPEFRERFIALVEGVHPPMQAFQKLLHLMDHLQGEPRELCSQFATTDENYKEVLEFLDQRYGEEDFVVADLLQKLRRIPTPEYTHKSLQAFHDVAYPLAVQLERTKVDLSAHSAHTTECLRKLPARLMTDHLKLMVPDRENQTLVKMLVALRGRIKDLRWHEVVYKQPHDEPRQQTRPGPERHRNNSGHQNGNRHDRGQVYAAQAERTTEGRTPYCALCPTSGHWPTQCTSYPDPKTRWARVRAMELCQCCLRKEQWRGQRSRHTHECKFCNDGRHHMSLCPKYEAKRSRTYKQRNRSPPPNGGNDQKPRTGRKVKFERDSKWEKRKKHASISESADQPTTNSGQESRREEPSLYDAYMGSLKPEDCPNYSYRPVISPVPDFDSEPEPESSDYSDTSDSEQSTDGAAYGSVVLNKDNGSETTCLLECVRTHVFHPETGRTMEATAFFDGGSTHSYVYSSFAEKLNLPKLRKSSFIVNTFGKDKPVKLSGFGTRIGFRLLNGKPLVLDVTTSDHVTSNMEAVFISAKDLPALRADKCAIVPSEQSVEILIGRRDFPLFNRGDSERMPSGFEVIKTDLGPILAGYGYVSSEQSVPTACTYHAVAKSEKSEDPLNRMADAFWRIDCIGMESSKPNADDEMVYQRVRAESIINEDGRYEVPLVFKTPSVEPPSNLELPQQRQASLGRLESVLHKLRKTPKILEAYKEYLEGLIARGEASIIPPEEIKTPNTCHYLAHHDVVKESSSTTKVRPVHDASAHPKGKPSLNDMLHRGPVILPKIVGCLLRSRFARIVILSDIAKAFMQVSITPSHRDLLRWFWVKDVNKPVSDENLLHVRFNRVAFGLKISPFLLAVVLEQHFQKYDSPVAREMLLNTYVDNVMTTAETVSEALQKYHESKQICADAKMQLREFVSNSKEFNEAIPDADRADKGNLKNLGIPWQCIADDWVISLHAKDVHPSFTHGTEAADLPLRKREVKGLTRRKMLAQLMAVYDPCGLVSPLLVAAKLVVQKVWEGKQPWDQAVPEPMEAAWREATADFSTTEIRIPRRVCDGLIAEARLHVFCDASADAYGFCTYLVCRSANGHRSRDVDFSLKSYSRPTGSWTATRLTSVSSSATNGEAQSSAPPNIALYTLSADFNGYVEESAGLTGRVVILDEAWDASFTNYSDCFDEVDSRHFDFLDERPPEHSSAVIHRHLRKAFVKHMWCNLGTRGFEWIVGMLMGLSDSTRVEELELYCRSEECRTLFGRFDEALIRRKVRELELVMPDPLFNALVAHHDFFRRPSIQQLKKLELNILHWNGPLEPYWLPALYELSECRHFTIHYEPGGAYSHGTVDMTPISTALCLMLQDFEARGHEIVVDHFSLLTDWTRIPSFVGDRNPAHEDIPVRDSSTNYSPSWNVYYYETADKKHCVTLFVAPEDRLHSAIHVKRGMVTDLI